jgi:hypothetical protein
VIHHTARWLRPQQAGVANGAPLSVRMASGRPYPRNRRSQRGHTISVPLGWYPRLLHGTPGERNHWRLIGGGEGIHWPDLDEDISVENLLAGKPSGESQRSFKRWLQERTTGRKQS